MYVPNFVPAMAIPRRGAAESPDQSSLRCEMSRDTEAAPRPEASRADGLSCEGIAIGRIRGGRE